MAELRIRVPGKDPRNTAAPAEPLFLFAGLLGMLLLLRSVRGISFSLERVGAGAALLCGLLGLSRRWGRSAAWAALAGAVLLSGGGAYLLREELAPQLRYLERLILSGPPAAAVDLTGVVLLCAAGAAALLFGAGCLLGCRRLFAILAAALLLCAVPAGLEVSPAALALLSLSAGGMLALRGPGWSRLRTGIAAALAVAAVLALSWPASARFSRQLGLPAYRAEELAYRAWRETSGTAGAPYADGGVSRGNRYEVGAVQLTLTADRRPGEPVYLRGFSGGEYVGGLWLPADDAALLERVEDALGWDRWGGTWGSMVEGMYRTMYYAVNRNVLREDPPEPVALTIRYDGDKYPQHFAPYYSRLESEWLTGAEGYTYQFFERRDMALDWENIPASFALQRDWNRQVYEAYAREAAAAYLQVPVERLPRLTRLAAANPRETIDEATAFILEVLGENAAYSQTPGWTPAGADVVEDFLFEKHRGYCVHYASAAVLLYRMYGIPARYAAGYLVRPEDFAAGEDGAWNAAVTDGAAHAWAEIFLPEYGWTPVEVTPDLRGEMTARYPGFDWAEQQELWAQLPAPVLPDAPAAAPAAPSRPRRESGGGSPRETALLWAACCLCLLGLLPFLLDRRRLIRLGRMEGEGCRAVFGRFLAMLSFCGVLPGWDGSEADFPRRAAEALPGIPPEELARLVAVVSAAAYGPGEPCPGDAAFALGVYRRAGEVLSARLPWHRRLVFRYWKAFG